MTDHLAQLKMKCIWLPDQLWLLLPLNLYPWHENIFLFPCFTFFFFRTFPLEIESHLVSQACFELGLSPRKVQACDLPALAAWVTLPPGPLFVPLLSNTSLESWNTSCPCEMEEISPAILLNRKTDPMKPYSGEAATAGVANNSIWPRKTSEQGPGTPRQWSRHAGFASH